MHFATWSLPEFYALLTCRSAKLIRPFVCSSVCVLAVVAQIEVTDSWGPISDVWTPSVSTTRYTRIRSLHPQLWILMAKVKFSHYNQRDKRP